MSHKKSILISGITGLLGGAILCFKDQHELFFLQRKDFDFSKNQKDLCQIIKKKFDIILHCAAMTDVELCEKEKNLASQINIDGTLKMLNFAEKNNAKFIFLSSTGNYGSYKSDPYVENDLLLPTTWHHKTKTLAEKLIMKNYENYLILRTGWLFGSFNSKNDYVLNRLIELNNDQKKFVGNSEQFGCPTFTFDLARQIFHLIDEDIKGIYNCVNNGDIVNRYDFNKEILSYVSNKNYQLIPVDNSYFERKAKVSMNESAINYNLKKIKFDFMPNWKNSLKKYFNNNNKLKHLSK